MWKKLIPIVIGLLGVLHLPAALGNCNRPATEYERQDCAFKADRDFRRGNSPVDQAVRQYQQNLGREAEAERERRGENARNAEIKPSKYTPMEYEGEKILRIDREKYENYRSTEFARIAAKFRSLDYGFEKPEMGADGYFYPVSMTVPFAAEMTIWTKKGYKKYPVELASLYGFMIAADPCADNPNQVGFPLSDQGDRSNFYYYPLNRHPECIYGRMYRAIPYLLQAQKSNFPPYRALACVQIEAWIARHFDNGVPRPEPKLFQGAVYHEGDYRYLTDKLAQCRAGLPHTKAFDEGLVQPARDWVRKTGNYFSDVRLVRFYDRNVWANVANFDDAGQIRAVFDEVIKDFNTITLAHPAIFTGGIDKNGGAGHAYR